MTRATSRGLFMGTQVYRTANVAGSDSARKRADRQVTRAGRGAPTCRCCAIGAGPRPHWTNIRGTSLPVSVSHVDSHLLSIPASGAPRQLLAPEPQADCGNSNRTKVGLYFRPSPIKNPANLRRGLF